MKWDAILLDGIRELLKIAIVYHQYPTICHQYLPSTTIRKLLAALEDGVGSRGFLVGALASGETAGNLLIVANPTSSLQKRLEPSRSLWVPLDPSRPLWILLDPSGSF